MATTYGLATKVDKHHSRANGRWLQDS